MTQQPSRRLRPGRRMLPLLAAFLLAAPVFAQSPLMPPLTPVQPATGPSGKPLAFTIVSVKPHGEQPFGRLSCIGDSCDIENMPLRTVISLAYGVQDDQLLIGGPSWLNSDRFDIVAKIDPSDLPPDAARPTFQQLVLMLQPVLADRFQLKVHHEMRTFAAYNIVIAKGGLKMKESTSPPASPPLPPGAPANASLAAPPPPPPTGGALPPPPPPPPGAAPSAPPGCRVQSKGNGFRSGRYCTTMDMERVFEYPAGRFLVDKTGLTAHYDFEFCYSNYRTPEGDPNYECPSVFTALQDQLGLHLDPTTASFDVLVIDSAEKPSAN